MPPQAREYEYATMTFMHGPFLIIWLIVAIVCVAAWLQIFRKAGYSGWLSLLMLLPLINLITFFWFAFFAKWPARKSRMSAD